MQPPFRPPSFSQPPFMPPSLVCPHCQQIDQIRRVSTIVGTETSHSRSYHYFPNRSGGSLLSAMGLLNNLDNARGTPPFASGLSIGKSQTELSQQLAPPKHPLSSFNSAPPILIRITAYIVIGVVIISIGSVPALLIFGAFIALAELIREGLRKQALTAMPRYNRQYALWQQFYYCYRDDGVFLPGQTALMSAQQMQQWIASIN